MTRPHFRLISTCGVWGRRGRNDHLLLENGSAPPGLAVRAELQLATVHGHDSPAGRPLQTIRGDAFETRHGRPPVEFSGNYRKTDDLEAALPDTGRYAKVGVRMNLDETRQVGLEPTTSRLTAGCSTIELLPKKSSPRANRARGQCSGSGAHVKRG